MTTQKVKREATLEDLTKIPENLVGEILNGDLITSPRPAPRHCRASSKLGADLIGTFDGGETTPGGWWILDEPELHLGRDTLVPDLAGWRRERLPRLPDEAYFALAPDWVCEILSDSTRAHDRVGKVPAYGRHGVAYLWLVDPGVRTLEVFVLQNQSWVLLSTHAEDDVVQAVPFDAIELALAPLWDRGMEPGV